MDIRLVQRSAAQVIRVQTSENAAGNIGYDEIAVSLEKRVIPGSTTGGGTDVTVNITFPAEPSLETFNTIQYYYGTDPGEAVTLTEMFPVTYLSRTFFPPAISYIPVSDVALLQDSLYVSHGSWRIQKYRTTGEYQAQSDYLPNNDALCLVLVPYPVVCDRRRFKDSPSQTRPRQVG